MLILIYAPEKDTKNAIKSTQTHVHRILSLSPPQGICGQRRECKLDINDIQVENIFENNPETVDVLQIDDWIFMIDQGESVEVKMVDVAAR